MAFQKSCLHKALTFLELFPCSAPCAFNAIDVCPSTGPEFAVCFCEFCPKFLVWSFHALFSCLWSRELWFILFLHLDSFANLCYSCFSLYLTMCREVQQEALTRSLLGINRKGKISYMCSPCFRMNKSSTLRFCKGKKKNSIQVSVQDVNHLKTCCLFQWIACSSAKEHQLPAMLLSKGSLNLASFICFFVTWWKRALY